MPMLEDMTYFRKYEEKRHFSLVSGLVPGGDVSDIFDVEFGSGWLSEMLHQQSFRVRAVHRD